jgi:hypothetical protein
LSVPAAPVAQTCSLLVSLGIVAGRDDFLPSTSNTQHPTSNSPSCSTGSIGCWAFNVGCWMFWPSAEEQSDARCPLSLRERGKYSVKHANCSISW